MIDRSARDVRVRAAYDAVAAPYAEHLTAELESLPFERWLLSRIVALADERPVIEVGSGSGHVTAFLAACGADAIGLDLSAGMVATARRHFPSTHFEVGDLRRLPLPKGVHGWGAILAWYSLIHQDDTELPATLRSLVRTLSPGGLLAYAGHAGVGVRHVADWFGKSVELDFFLREPAEIAALFESVGLVDVEWYRRGPIRSRGETTERAYVMGRRALP